MKNKLIATILLFVLFAVGCQRGNSIIGKWQMSGYEKQTIGGEDIPQMEFLSDGTYYAGVMMKGKWQRLDDSHLKIQTDKFGMVSESSRVVTFKIENDILTVTESDGKVTEWRR